MTVKLNTPIAAYDYDIQIAAKKVALHLEAIFGKGRVAGFNGTYDTAEDTNGITVYIAIAESVKLHKPQSTPKK